MSTFINGRKLDIFSCHMNNIPENVIIYQKKVFDYFDMELNQEFSPHNTHHEWLDYKINNIDFDIIVFFDIDCIPLKPKLYEYIVQQIEDNKSFIGIEQANQDIDYNFIYAGPACFAITREAFEKMNKPSFKITKNYDVGGEFTYYAKDFNVTPKFFKFKIASNKKWKLGNDRKFGNGSIYDDWLYHQFEVRYYPHIGTGQYDLKAEDKIHPYKFIQKCKQIINNYD